MSRRSAACDRDAVGFRSPRARLRACFVTALLIAAPAAADDHLVLALPDNTFSPASLDIALGDTVTWRNDGGLHNVNAEGFFRCAEGCDGEGGDGDPSASDWSFTRTFDEEATIDYVCDAHVALGMVGQVVVGSGGVGPPGLSVTGGCPGSIHLEVSGVTPEGGVALLAAAAEGSDPIPAGPCAGIELGLAEPRLLGVQTVDSEGGLVLDRSVPQGACGQLLQAVDLTTCESSPVADLPEAGRIALTPLAEGLAPVTNITHAGDGSGRLLVALQSGLVVIFENDRLLPEPFLDIRDRVNYEPPFEQGLVGLAFHPEYPENGRFYVVYNDSARDSVLAEFLVSSDDADRADAGSERRVLLLPQPESIHNLGQLAFGPDGYLYVGSGDGGPIFDPEDRAQDLGLPYGKILRLDVDSDDFPGDEERNYAVPGDNPFVGDPGALPEIWVYGLRNPWRFSFDRATGDLYVGDVGEGRREEVSLQPAASPGGENYGWSLAEGTLCFDPPVDCEKGVDLTPPILEYDHFTDSGFFGCAVTGGYRYRGVAVPELEGLYVFGDLCTGKIYGGAEVGGSWQARLLLDSTLFVSTFGEDEEGELFVGAGGAGPGAVYRVVSP